MAENPKVLNVLIPIAGKAQRFADAGYNMPKPLIKVDGEDIIDKAMDSLKHCSEGIINYIFVVRRDHVQKYGIDKYLTEHFRNRGNIKIVISETDTEGALCTCLLAEGLINKNERLLIFTPDIEFSQVNLKEVLEFNDDIDGVIYTFKANSEAHSYAKTDGEKVVKTAEKEIISQNAALGLYYFKNGRDFVKWAKYSVQRKDKIKNEYYICPLYNYFIKNDEDIKIREVQEVHVLGTPEDVEFYEKNLIYGHKSLRIGVCCDHSGFELKEKFVDHLYALRNNEWDHPVIDYGTYLDLPCDYSDYCIEACNGLKRGEVDIVFGFCRTGNGVNICANNQEGVISALVTDAYTATHARTHNCANFIAVPSRYMETNELLRIASCVLVHDFEGGRHATRLRKFL